MDFDFYKNYLIDYLKKCGVEIRRVNGLSHCFNPNHSDDRKPSCQISENHFHCYSCGIDGDICDAVEIIEGITSKKEQLLYLEKIYGSNYIPTPSMPKSEKLSFKPDTNALDTVKNYLHSHKAKQIQIENFLRQRATISSGNKINNYSETIVNNLQNYMTYWPGLDTAQNDGLTIEVLQKAGILASGKRKSSWYHAGIVLTLGTGLKLHYYNDNKCEKRGSIGCTTFPMPYPFDKEKIVLVEGELDAVVSQAAGFDNVYSTGGTQGLTKPKIKKYILPTVKEITILYDNDEAGKKAAGLVKPGKNDNIKTNLPERLRQAGFTGNIRIAELEVYKDPDECILHGRLDLIQKAIDNAKLFSGTIETDSILDPATPENNTNNQAITRGELSIKDATKLLKLLPKTVLADNEIQPFIDSMINAVPSSYEFDIISALKEWGASDFQIHKIHDIPGTYLVDIARIHALSFYYIQKIEFATVTKDSILKSNPNKPIVDIDYNLIDNSEDLKTFIYKRGEKAAAAILALILENKLIYIETDKKFFHFNGLVWERVSDISGITYNILKAIIHHYTKETQPDDHNRIRALNICLTKIEEVRFCKTIMAAVAEKKEIFREQITFDGPAIQETLTLQDGVIDFSGTKIHYRNSRPEEYRMKILPYTIDQVKDDKKPNRFIKFMKGNFRNNDTYETLMYYLSLLPSRRAQFKVGGIFVGVSNTGKTTTMNIINKIYPEMIAPIPREVIMSTRYSNSNAGPNPYIARLEGAGAGLSDETQRNDILNSAMWKQLTGGGILTARGMYSSPRNFMPTAQIIILTNFSPKFDGKDQATINRMVVIPFNVQHLPTDKNTMEEKDLEEMLEPEFPLVVRLFAEYYINLKTKYKSKIPLSSECEGYKQDYVENQETDLDRFVTNNIEFIKDDNIWVTLKDIYQRFAQVNSIELDQNGKPLDKEEWSQSKFTRYFKGDYNEVRIKQKKINGYPEQVVLNCRLKDIEIKETKTKQEEKPAPCNEEIPF